MSYTVQSGDTLIGIAIQHNVNFNEILALNPQYQPNPNLIHPGDVVTLPSAPPTNKDMAPIVNEPPPEKRRPLCSDGTLEAPPQCQGVDIHDILFQTDEQGSYYCLDEQSLPLLEKEISATEHIIAAYQALTKDAPKPDTATEQALLDHANKKKQWAIDAANAGAIAPQSVQKTPTSPSHTHTNENQERVSATLQELRRRQRLVQYYVPPFLGDEPSVLTLRQQTLKAIQKDIDYYEKLNQTKPNSSPQSPKVGKIELDNFANSKTLTTTPAKRHVVEFFSVSRNRLVYVRAEFLERERLYWRRRSIQAKTLSALRAGNTAAFKQAILDDIKQGITKDLKSPKVEGIIKQWKAEGGNSGEWKASHYVLNDDGETRFATSAEAQLLRWGMGAAIKSTVKPTEGKVDVGISVSAQVALAEASVKLESFLPYQAGFPISLSYTDENKQTQEYSFGRFRTRACVTMNCFAGVMGSATAEVSNQVQEQVAGHSVLLAPSVSMGQAQGRIGVKAEGFAGAQVGGELTGGIEWQAPPPQPKASLPDFGMLAEIKAEGNLAFGAGAGVDYQIVLDQGKLIFYCNGRLVWGPGGSGGFGAAINFEHAWSLAQVIWQGLQYIDYRQLKNINGLMYDFLVESSYMAFAANVITNPSQALMKAINAGEDALSEWYLTRQSRQDEAEILARRILDKEVWSGTTPDKLLPETIGMMLDTLTETFARSFEKQQEKAICYLVSSSISSWRKFEEVLARMNPKGKKQSGDKILFDNLARLNAILDHAQQREFNRWVQSLANKELVTAIEVRQHILAFTPSSTKNMRDKIQTITEQYAKINQGSDSRYV